MDGVLLVLETRNLPNLHALAPLTVAPAKAQSKRNRAVPAFATIILALVLGMVYYVSIHRRAAQKAYTQPSAATTLDDPAPVVNPTPEPQPSQEVQAPAPPETEPTKAAPTKQPAATTPAKKQPAKASSATNQTEPKKDESKVGSLLKKTGRILKKPFKF
jgi:cytoskeletal protein RodZ